MSICFGQEGLLKTETKPSLMFGYGFHSQTAALQKNSQLQPPSFYASYKRPLFNSFITNALIMQAEGETLQPKNSFWKQAGIYGLEFVGAGICSGIPSILGLTIALYATIDNHGDPGEGYHIYMIGNVLLSSTGSWFVGKLCNQNPSWWKSAIGAAVGSGIGIFVLDKWLKRKEKGSFYPESIIFFGAPPLCAAIGSNL